MAEAREELILEIDVSNSVTKLAELRQSMDALIAQREVLSEKSKAGDKEAAKELEKLNSTVRNTQVEYKAQQRVLDGYTNSQKVNINTSNLAANSIQANRDLLKQLTAQYIQLKNPSANATAQIKHLSTVLKEQEAAIGNTTRNVGNYSQGFSDITGKLVSLFPALQSVAVAQQGVNAAMSANPIGLVVVGIQALMGVLSFFQPVMESIERATAGFSAGFGALVNGGNILEAAKQASILKGQLQDLEEAQNGVNIANAETDRTIGRLLLRLRNKSLTEEEAAKTLSDIAKADRERLDRNLTQENAILKQKEENFKIINNLTQKEVDALVERGQLVNQLDDEELARLQRLSKDSGISLEQLIKDAKASQLAVADIAEQKAKQKKVEFDAEIKAITDQRIKIIAIEEESELLGEKVATRRATIDDRFKAAREKQEAEAERLKEKEIQRLEKINIANEKALSTIRENAILQLEIQKQTGKTSEEIDLLFQESKLRNFKDFAAEQFRIQKEINEESKRIQLENSNDQKAIEQLRLNAQLQADLQRQTKLSEEEVDRMFLESKYTLFKDFYDSLSNLYKTDAAEYKKQQETRFQVASSVVSSLSSLSNLVGQDTAAGLAFQKTAALAQIAIDTAKSISSAIAGATSSATATGPGAFIATPIFIATTIATVLGAIASATAVLSRANVPAAPKLAYGGSIDIDGKPHSGGGTPIHVNGRLVAEAEVGEKMFILKKSASEQIGLLSAFNQFFGGRSFTGSPVKHAASGGFIADGGFANRELSRGIDNSLSAQNMEEILKRLPAPEISIVEFESKQSSRNRSVKVSEA